MIRDGVYLDLMDGHLFTLSLITSSRGFVCMSEYPTLYMEIPNDFHALAFYVGEL